jgi:hypothetical protein
MSTTAVAERTNTAAGRKPGRTQPFYSRAVVIGAGPYGLAAAAHLNAAGIEMRAFGEPMSFWRNSMPEGMKLRSPWRGSHISDPNGRLSLDHFVECGGMQQSAPIPLEDFIRYGEWFQRQAVPNLDRRKVVQVDRAPNGFRLTIEGGEAVYAHHVLMATGLANQAFVPPEFRDLPRELASHSVEHASLGAWRGRRVAVIGRGQSAMESAALLREAGAEVEVISRGAVHWIGSEVTGTEVPGSRQAGRRLHRLVHHLSPPSPVGPFPMSWLVDTPSVMRRLPDALRQKINRRSLRPAAAAWLLPRTEGVRLHPGRLVIAAEPKGGGLLLKLDNGDGLTVDHALLATGYKIDISKQGILSPALLDSIERVDGCPVLSAGMESSVSGLHFLGCSSVPSYGGLMRFVWGAGCAARLATRAIPAGRK